MHVRLFASLLVSIVATSVAAMDAADAANYRVVNVKNEPTRKLFRLVGGPGAWRIEDQQPDGSWEDVTCEGGCTLKDSTEGDVKRFFPADDLSAKQMTCVHNTAFAFCRYGSKVGQEQREYVLVALTLQQPVPIRLRRE